MSIVDSHTDIDLTTVDAGGGAEGEAEADCPHHISDETSDIDSECDPDTDQQQGFRPVLHALVSLRTAHRRE